MSSNCVNGYPPFGTPQQVCPRSRIVLAAASGQSDSAIARELELNRHTVILWRRRFQQEGLDGLWEIAPGGGPKPTYGSEKVASFIDATLRTKPEGMTQPELPADGRQPGSP